MANLNRVPVSKTGHHGWTLCCGAAVETALDENDPRPLISGYGGRRTISYCKCCWAEVEEFELAGLDLVLMRFFAKPYTDSTTRQAEIEDAIAAQGRLLELARKNESRRATV